MLILLYWVENCGLLVLAGWIECTAYAWACELQKLTRRVWRVHRSPTRCQSSRRTSRASPLPLGPRCITALLALAVKTAVASICRQVVYLLNVMKGSRFCGLGDTSYTWCGAVSMPCSRCTRCSGTAFFACYALWVWSTLLKFSYLVVQVKCPLSSIRCFRMPQDV